MGTDQERRHPEYEAVTNESGQCGTNSEMPHRAHTPHMRSNCTEPRRLLVILTAMDIHRAAPGLADGQVQQGRNRQTGEPDDHERYPPAPVVADPAANQVCQQ
jgi:hypothetical protein